LRDDVDFITIQRQQENGLITAGEELSHFESPRLDHPPDVRKEVRSGFTQLFSEYDNKELWMRFSEKASGSLSLNDLMPKMRIL
jgi:hypothetical protein